jgi:hypothetical protein
MTIARIVPFSLVAGAFVFCNVHAQPLTLDQGQQIARIESSLRDGGPDKTIRKFFDCTHGIGYDLVDTGAASAVKVAVELLPKSDACVTESLHASLTTALSRNPQAVLPYVDQSPLLSHDQICVPLMIEVPKRQALRELRQTEGILRTVHGETLRRSREACLVVVERSIRNVEASPDH